MPSPALPDPSLPPIGDGTRRTVLVAVSVPENWDTRPDMEQIVERELAAGRWVWQWHSETVSGVPA